MISGYNTIYSYLSGVYGMGYAEARALLRLIPSSPAELTNQRIRDKVARRIARRTGWHVSCVTVLRKLKGKLKGARRLDSAPPGFIPIGEAEMMWGRPLLPLARSIMEDNGRSASVVCLGGKWTVLMRAEFIRNAYGAPMWTGVPMVARELGITYMTAYARLRAEGIHSKSFIAWRGGRVRVYRVDEVQDAISFWRRYRHSKNAALFGREMDLKGGEW